MHRVAEGPVQGENASGENAIREAAAVFDFDLESPQAVVPIRHASRGSGVGDQYGAIGSLRMQEKLHQRRDRYECRRQ